MKTTLNLLVLFISFTLLLCVLPALAGDRVALEYKPAGDQGEVSLHSQFALPVSATYPEYYIQCTTNMQTWETVAGPINGSVGVSDELLRIAVPLAGDRAFYRVVASVKMDASGDEHGDAIYGYATEFSKQLQSLGQLPLEDFVQMYTLTNEYLPQITFDPTTSEFWDLFNGNPDFGLDADELAVFQTNGFVVSERLATYSFGDAFYDIFEADLPVFFSTDAALQAWHFSYLAMLEELEETILMSLLQDIILGMQGRIPELWAEATNTALTNGVLDADYYLAVARSLVTSTNHDGYLGQSDRVAQTLGYIDGLQTIPVTLFGEERWTDFSQFKVRGHYENSERLSNYFRAMMWCGFIDFRFSGGTNAAAVRELSGAVALTWLLERSGQGSNWARFDWTVELFVGLPDSMNFAQLGALLTEANIHSPSDLTTVDDLVVFQSRLMSGDLGLQSIVSDWHPTTPFATKPIKLPRSFRVLGQRFVPDSWCLGKCVFDRIIWDEDGILDPEDRVVRRVPSALDVAFGVFANDHIVPEIAARIAREGLMYEDGRVFWRDGLPYQHNLAAVRNVIDLQEPSAWTNSIYTHWLACLRELSTPTPGPEYPQAMRTRAWAMKTLNTQLASWTQLRHDTVLYAKQSYTVPIVCSYPDAFVEPRPMFWQRMKEMAQHTRVLLENLPSSGTVYLDNLRYDGGDWVSLERIHLNRLSFLDGFAHVMSTLQGIAEKELAREPFSADENLFLEGLISSPFEYAGIRDFSGWYPTLFYANVRQGDSVGPDFPWQSGGGPDLADALVTDVHTDTLDTLHGDPGSVLHQGVGNVNLLMIAVDCGPGDLAVYAGPVLSHYEFEMEPDTRMTDSEWKAKVTAGDLPPQPEWTESYLVPNP